MVIWVCKIYNLNICLSIRILGMGNRKAHANFSSFKKLTNKLKLATSRLYLPEMQNWLIMQKPINKKHNINIMKSTAYIITSVDAK